MTLQGYYTNKGRTLAAKIAAGTAAFTVTRVVAGSGHTTDIPSATDLTSQKQTLSVGLPTVEGMTATLPVTLLEAGASVDYALTELGVYANDPDAGEILFQVYQLDTTADIIAGGEGVLRFYLRQSIGADGVSVICSPAGVVLEEDIAELRAKAEYADHRNLLDNPFFTVNQRGVTNGQTLSNAYGFDRWKCLNIVPLIVDYTDNKIAVGFKDDGPAMQPFLAQYLERDWQVGEFYTLSALVKGKGLLGMWPDTILFDTGSAWEIVSMTRKATDSHQSFKSVSIGVSDSLTADFLCRAVKLERGTVSTLANDTAPNYAEELAKCQRFFQRFKTQALRPADRDDFRPVMRVNPALSTITVDGVTYYTATADL